MNKSAAPTLLPPGVRVFERGWLSSNNILIDCGHSTALVDTGYSTHSAQTVALVQSASAVKPLGLVLNTHLHSDHCGGNDALQQAFPSVRTLIPPGLAHAVQDWDPVALTYAPTGQHCTQFRFDGLLLPGTEIDLGDLTWEVHGAPGHDPHSVILFEPDSRTLISADALWENGFGIVFQELEGVGAFDEVGATLEIIDALKPRVVIPGHGSVFTDVGSALIAARARLQVFTRDPRKHARHAAKVLLKFKLLEIQRAALPDFMSWALGTVYFRLVHQRFFTESTMNGWLEQMVGELAASSACRLEGPLILNN